MKKQLRKQAEQVTPKQALGAFFIILSVFTYAGGLAYISAYWDNIEYVETYRDYDIHYFPKTNFYGIDTGGEASEWPYNSELQGARNMIDSWLDEAEYVETYRDFEVYKLPSLSVYYGEGLDTKTLECHNLTVLHEYIDDMYYPTRIRTIRRQGDTWKIYRQGRTDTLRYWARNEDTMETSPEYESFDPALQYVYDIYDITEGDTEETGNSTQPSPEPVTEYPGETIGDRLNAQKNLVSGISAAIGVGLVAIDFGEKRDN